MFSRAVEIREDAQVLLYTRKTTLQWRTVRGKKPPQTPFDYHRPHTAPMNPCWEGGIVIEQENAGTEPNRVGPAN